MFIKSIVLDGFKSYGQRTEITGFDEQFNAITGLNGSGKSNVLDSICFVLGISNLSHVGYMYIHILISYQNVLRLERVVCKTLFLSLGKQELIKLQYQSPLTTQIILNVQQVLKITKKLQLQDKL